MALIRLVLLLGLAGGLFLLVQFNWSPIQLTFLGIQTPAWPLALWILGAIGAGVVTNLLITSLFGLSNYFAVRAARSRFRQASRPSGFQSRSTSSAEPRSAYARASTSTSTDDDADWNNWDGYEEPADRASSRVRSPANDDPIDDWEAEPSDDWEDDEPRDTPRDTRSTAASARTNYEAKQEPRTSSRQGSVYSYSYREPKDSGVGKAEPVTGQPVVDADYRVIVPPFRPLDAEPAPAYEEPAPTESADDWFEEDDDNFDADRISRRDR
jgi:uncharacterized integral membrane protein